MGFVGTRMMKATIILAIFLSLKSIVCVRDLIDGCDKEIPEPIKFVLRSYRTSKGEWVAKTHLERDFNPYTGARDVHVSVERNTSSCEDIEPINIVANIVVSPLKDVPGMTTYSAVEGGIYRLHKEEEDWHQADHICNAEDAMLGVINSEAEASSLKDILFKAYREDESVNIQAYIGASNFATDGVLVTLDGRYFNSTGIYNKFVENYKTGNPDKDCVTLERNGLLNTVPCSTKLPFFCKKRTLDDHSKSATNDQY